MPTLFDPLQVGDVLIANRIVMAPLTRARAGASRIPNDLMAEYYRQRASTGLIITEATVVSAQGIGYADTPGIWSQQQVEGWKKVTQAVHAEGGKIFLQLWHVGRISHPLFLNGELPVAPSALAPEGRVSLVRPETPYVVPRALRREELPGIVEAFRTGAQNAQLAGFDGVELHGANGYLLDQFLQDGSNKRTDDYGGSVENRARLLLEATRRYRCGAQAGWACISRRAATPIAWAIPARRRLSAMSHANWANAASPLFVRVNTLGLTAWVHN